MTTAELIAKLQLQRPDAPVVVRAADGSHIWIVAMVTGVRYEEQLYDIPKATVLLAGSEGDVFTRSEVK